MQVTFGDNICSAISGKVIQVSNEGTLGNHIKIENNIYQTVYAHCSEINVIEGSNVKQGEVIAKIGNSGNSTGNHLHFEVIKDGQYIDPMIVIYLILK